MGGGASRYSSFLHDAKKTDNDKKRAMGKIVFLMLLVLWFQGVNVGKFDKSKKLILPTNSGV